MKKRVLILTGFMGTGKTTVGEIVARKLGCKFYDLDGIIEQEMGMSIAEIFKQKGETNFRKTEAKILRKLLDGRKAVLATGGGTLITPENRLLALNSGEVFCLTALPHEIKRRLAKYRNRPLLNLNGTIEKIRALLKKRASVYDSFVNQVDTTGLSPFQAAEVILRRVNDSYLKRTAEFRTPLHTCEVMIEGGCLRKAGKLIKPLNPSQVFVLTNSAVRKLYYKELEKSLKRAGFFDKVMVIPAGEKFKNLESLSSCYDFLVKHKADRSSLLITLGGGVITDLGGMLAATYMRGIKLVHIPTTLLAQVDASIGGKSAVNHALAKNTIGCFYQPNRIIIDPAVLITLNQREYLNGLAEVIKIALVADPSLFEFLKSNLKAIVERREPFVTQIIFRAVNKKLEITQKDPFERGLRKILNFGHTFGHALEAQKKFGRISHGEAVPLGMLVALRLSADLEIGKEATLTAVKGLLKENGLPTKIRKLDPKALWKIMCLDKKANSGKINFVLLRKIGKPIVKAVEYEQFKRACRILN